MQRMPKGEEGCRGKTTLQELAAYYVPFVAIKVRIVRSVPGCMLSDSLCVSVF